MFERIEPESVPKGAPLARRMRPRSLDEFAGQDHIVGPGTQLRRAIEQDELGSIVLWGPPGTGKTSLASVIAHSTGGHFEALSAVMAGIRDLRALIARAKERRMMDGRRTLVLIDELHRFNKAQQDALLPHVEDATIVLVGATTENPYFEVISALVSRSRVFRLEPLSDDDMETILQRAMADRERGYGGREIQMDERALVHLIRVAGGDARIALNALEAAVEASPAEENEAVQIDLAIAQDAIQRKALLYDKDGDAHYDTASAFIKSLRGSDPDAALYWLARMLYAGEDPRFIVRRMIILASEDVGNADPQALVVANAAAQALEWVGLPEAEFALAQAATYLATAPKSNSALAIKKALGDVEKEPGEVPDHLKDPTVDGRALGHGKGYRYPHDHPGHFVAQQYLPDRLRGRRYYEPSEQGYEAELRRRLEAWRRRLAEPGGDADEGPTPAEAAR